MTDDLRFIPRRKAMVEELWRKGIRDELVLKAMGAVFRHHFVELSFRDMAYFDKALPIGCGQTISQPLTVARQTELLVLKGGENVLEIGTGSGYQAAVLAECNVQLTSIERQPVLYEKTSKMLRALGYNVRCILGDGFNGCAEYAPYDRIIVTAGASEVPENLLLQLKVGGIMVLPFGSENNLQMYRITRQNNKDFKSENMGACAFVPMLKGVNF